MRYYAFDLAFAVATGHAAPLIAPAGGGSGNGTAGGGAVPQESLQSRLLISCAELLVQGQDVRTQPPHTTTHPRSAGLADFLAAEFPPEWTKSSPYSGTDATPPMLNDDACSWFDPPPHAVAVRGVSQAVLAITDEVQESRRRADGDALLLGPNDGLLFGEVRLRRYRYDIGRSSETRSTT